MKYIAFLLFFNLYLNASFLFSNLDNQQIKLSSKMEYLEHSKNSNKIITSLDILYSKELKKLTSSNFGLDLDKEIWTKTTIKNEKNLPLEIVLLNPKSLNESLKAWVYKNGNLIQTLSSGLLENRDDYDKLSIFTNIKIVLDPYGEYQIITRIENKKSRVDVEWIAMSEDSFNKLSLYNNFIWGIILGGILLLFILHILLYLTIKNKSFLSYIIYILLCLIYFFTNNGYFALFFGGGYISLILAHLSAYAVALFYILFLDEYMELSKKNRYKYVLKPIYIYYTFIATTSWVIIFSPMIYQYDFYYFVFTFITIVALIIITSIESYKTKVIPIFYILGQISLLIGYIAIFLVALKITPSNIYSQQTMGIFMFLEMILFTLAIFIKLRDIVETKQKDERLILSQSHFSTIGQMLRNIAHQWKVPAVRLGTLITEMESIFYIKKFSEPKLNNIVEDMRKNIVFMENTIKEFSEFYSKTSESNYFKPIDEIYNIKTLLAEKIHMQNLCIECENSMFDFKMYGISSTFSHVVLILIENVIDVSQRRDIKSPKIKIYLEKAKQNIYIHFQDNCGGIEQKPINKIFELEITSYNEKNRGTGLTIAKMLVEEKLKAKIIVNNFEDGARFTIVI